MKRGAVEFASATYPLCDSRRTEFLRVGLQLVELFGTLISE
jgi:hypothetical protein